MVATDHIIFNKQLYCVNCDYFYVYKDSVQMKIAASGKDNYINNFNLSNTTIRIWSYKVNYIEICSLYISGNTSTFIFNFCEKKVHFI